MADTAIPKGSTVLITGATGYIGSYCVAEFVKHGYKVRATSRNQEKAELLRDILKEKYGKDLVEIVLVKDMTDTASYQEAIKGVSALIHVASDVSMNPDPEVVIKNAVGGTTTMLDLASAEPSVKRFVLTSSSIASHLPVLNKEFHFDASQWNDESVAMAKASTPEQRASQPLEEAALVAYAASKTVAEKALWSYMKEKKPHFVANSVLPNLTIGPTLHDKLRGSTHNWIRGMFNSDPFMVAIMKAVDNQYWVNVEDIGRLHYAAAVYEDVQNERLFGFTGKYNFNTYLDAMAKFDPKKELPAKIESSDKDISTVDNALPLKLLQRLGQSDWVGFEETMRANLS